MAALCTTNQLPTALPQAHQLINELRAELAQTRVSLAEATARNQSLEASLHKLQRLYFGRKSERVVPRAPMPPMSAEVRKACHSEPGKEQTRAQITALRQERKTGRAVLAATDVVHEVDESDKECAACKKPFRPLGGGEISYSTEWVPGHLARRRHIRQKYVCRCGETIIMAKSPKRVGDKTTYGPGFHALVAVSKCADSMPLHRQVKQMARHGLTISKSTLGDIFHRTADNMEPIYGLILSEVANSKHLNADETTIQMQAKEKTKRCYMWVFVNETCVAYVFNVSRGGHTPHHLLHGTTGMLQVDGYTGYNAVCVPEGRTRAGCWAHVRRYFYDATETAPHEADEALAMILQMYRVEYEAAQQGCLRTPRHLLMRQEMTRPHMKKFKMWMAKQKTAGHVPQSPLMKAIQYTERAWTSLVACIDDVKVYLDNNISERALRQIALGRKNYMFVGSEEAGRNLAINQTIVASCQMAGVNPQEYLTDVLIRIQSHPAKEKQQLMPANWKKLFSKTAEAEKRA